MKRPQAQVAVLQAADAQEDRRIDDVAAEADLKPEAATRAAFELEADGLLAVSEETLGTRTHRGRRPVRPRESARQDLYEAAIDAGAADGPVQMGQVIGASGLGRPRVDIALANFGRKGYGEIDSGALAANQDADAESDPECALEAVADGRVEDADADALEQLDGVGSSTCVRKPSARSSSPTTVSPR